MNADDFQVLQQRKAYSRGSDRRLEKARRRSCRVRREHPIDHGSGSVQLALRSRLRRSLGSPGSPSSRLAGRPSARAGGKSLSLLCREPSFCREHHRKERCWFRTRFRPSIRAPAPAGVSQRRDQRHRMMASGGSAPRRTLCSATGKRTVNTLQQRSTSTTWTLHSRVFQ